MTRSVDLEEGKPANKAFKSMTVPELRMMAESLGIDHAGLKKIELREAIREADNEVTYFPEKRTDYMVSKVEMAERVKKAEQASDDNVITAPKKAVNTEPTISTDDSEGIFMSEVADTKRNIVSDEEADEGKVALYSERNISLKGAGKIEKGFNFVTKGKAETWSKFRGIREATPQEVAAHYGVE